MTTIELPWPPSSLSPNARQHHMAHYRAKKRYRDACIIATRMQKPRLPDGPLRVQLEFVPVSGFRYDRDNLIGRMKAALDGVAIALGIDDHRFAFVGGRISAERAAPRGAKVVVRITRDEVQP